jgi:hypothetical protein
MASCDRSRTELAETCTGVRAERDHSPVHAAVELHDPGTKSALARTSVCRVFWIVSSIRFLLGAAIFCRLSDLSTPALYLIPGRLISSGAPIPASS